MRIMPMARLTALSCALALAMGLAACSPTNLYVASNTVIGVNGAMNADQTSGHLIVGYDRRFAAIVPKSVQVLNDDGSVNTNVDKDAREAMGVLSCSELKVEGIFLTGFTEYLATGEAARRFAKKVADEAANKGTSADMTKFFNCLIPRAPNDPPPAQPQAQPQS
jgi:hypothetical protein